MDVRYLKLAEINNYFNEFTGIVKLSNQQGNYDINKISENRAIGLFNLIYGYDLKNANYILSDNFPAVDLIDNDLRVCIQVTSTSEKDKIIYTLQKFIEKKLYNDFDRIIIYILTDKPAFYKSKTHKETKAITKGYIDFDLKRDVLDNKDLAKVTSSFVNIKQILAVHDYLAAEFNKVELQDAYPKELNAFARFRPDSLVGRELLIGQIHEKFNDFNIVLLQGVGGIGKTVIAKSYLEIYKEHYDHLAYIDASDSLISAIVKRLSSFETTFNYNDGISIAENLSNLINKLYLIKNTLLIIDNCDNEIELRQLKGDLESLNWKILITSRTLPPTYAEEVINVTHISSNDAFALFVKNYGRKVTEIDSTIIERILLKIKYHTKLTIILGKAAHNNPLLKLEELADRVNKEMYNEDKINILVALDTEEHKVYDFLLLLFEPELLTLEQKRYLKYFTILPSIEISVEHLVNLYERNEKHGSFINIINKLVEKGWVESYNNYFRIHPVIQLVTKNKLVINVANCSNLIDNVIYYLRLTDNYTVNLAYLNFGESVAKFFDKDVDEKLGILYNYLSILSRDVYRLKDALKYSLQAIEILEKHSKQIEMLAQVYGNTSTYYSKLNDFDKAIYYMNQTLKIQQKLFPKDHHDIAATYNNFATAYFNAARNSNSSYEIMHYYDTALGYLNHSLEMLERLSARKPREHAPAISDCCTLQANIYEDLYYLTRDRNYLDLYFEADTRALQLVTGYLGENHPKTATVYNNNGLGLLKHNNIKHGFEFIEKALIIRRNILPDNHPDIGVSLYNIARAYLALKQKKLAVEALKESIEILQSVKDFKHDTLEAALKLYKSLT